MQIEKILEKLSTLFQKWGLRRDDWSLVGEWSLWLQGYDIKPRKGHIDIEVNRRKLPWKVRLGEDSTIPPKHSREFQELKEFINQTHFGPHLIPLPLGPSKIKDIVSGSVLYALPNKDKIRIEKPKVDIEKRLRILQTFARPGVWDAVKIARWIDYFRIVQKAAQEKKDKEIIKACILALRGCEKIGAEYKEKKEIKWVKLGQWKSSLLFLYCVYEGEKKNFLTNLGLGQRTEMKNRQDIESESMIDEKDWLHLRNAIHRKIEQDKIFFRKYAGECYKATHQLIAISGKIKKLRTIYNFTNKQLKRFFIQYIKAVEANIPFLNTFLIIDEILAERIQETSSSLLQKRKIKTSQLGYYIQTLILPKRLPSMVLESRELLKIAKRIQGDNKITKFFQSNTSKKIADNLEGVNKAIYLELLAHQDKFGWMNIYGWLGQPFDLEYYIKRIKNLLKSNCRKELLRLKKEQEEKERRVEEVIKELRIDKNPLGLIDTIREYGYLRAYRFDVYSISQYNIRNLITEIAKRNGISYLDVIYSTPQEIVSWLEGKGRPNIPVIKERQKEYAIVKLGGGKITIYSGRKLTEFKQGFKAKDYSRLKEIKGNVAFPGKIRGRTRIVLDGSMVKRIKEGDILVAPMTNPDYMPAISKVSAIITDQGGILCHAAIISREFKIPCIIGTKVATQVLKDGQLIEVDANKGIVRVIK